MTVVFVVLSSFFLGPGADALLWWLSPDAPYYPLAVFPFLVLCPAAVSWAQRKTSGQAFAAYSLYSVSIIAMLFYRYIWAGFQLLANRYFAIANRQRGFAFVLYDTSAAQGVEKLCGTVALMLLILILSVLVSWGIRQRLAVFVFLLTAPFPFLGLYVLGSIPPVPMLILCCTWLVAAVYCAPAGHRKAKMLLQSTRGATVAVSLAATAAALVVALMFTLWLPAQRFDDQGGMAVLREGMISAVDKARYAPGKADGGIAELPRGEMNNAQSMHFTWKNVLAVMLERPRSLYLKGFTGGEYAGNRWSEPSDEAYAGEYAGLFEWLVEQEFYAQLQLGRVGAMTMGAQSGWISVSNLALGSKYIYAPYEALPTEDMSREMVKYDRDINVLSRGLQGARIYTFDMYLPVIEDYGSVDLHYWLGKEVLDSAAYEEYLEYETLYRSFVYDTYLVVPDEEDAMLKEYYSAQSLEALKTRDYRDVVRNIRQHFSDAFSFSYDIEPLEPGANFIATFLQSGIGYDVHFASLAALLLREAGVPARYAEGFYITPADIALYAEATALTFYLPDASAHAWTEVYVDGVGWLPVEFTPGYYSLLQNTVSSEGLTEMLKENKSFYYMADMDVPMEEEPPEEEPDETIGLHSVLAFFLLILLLLALWYGVRRLYLSRRRKGFAHPDTRRAALSRFAYLSRILRYDGAALDNHNAYAALDAMNGKYDPTGLSLERFLDVVYKARFSEPGRALNREDAEYLGEYSDAVCRMVYQRQNKARRVWMRLIWLV